MKRLIAIALIVLIVGIGGYIRSGQENVGLAPEDNNNPTYILPIISNDIQKTSYFLERKKIKEDDEAKCPDGFASLEIEWRVKSFRNRVFSPDFKYDQTFPVDFAYADGASKVIKEKCLEGSFSLLDLQSAKYSPSNKNWEKNHCKACSSGFSVICNVKTVKVGGKYDVILTVSKNVHCSNQIPITGPSIGG
jgi:hypothetical protein